MMALPKELDDQVGTIKRDNVAWGYNLETATDTVEYFAESRSLAKLAKPGGRTIDDLVEELISTVRLRGRQRPVQGAAKAL